MPEIGINGQTSTAPILGCSPKCFRISISSLALEINLNAASTIISASPTNVITVLLVAFPGSTFNNLIPGYFSTVSTILFMTDKSFPSEIFGTHSTNFFIITL